MHMADIEKSGARIDSAVTVFYVSFAGASVRVVADDDQVRQQLDDEIGDFFRIESERPSSAEGPGLLLAEIRYASRAGSSPDSASERILLHEGSHSYDGRYGDLWNKPAGGRVIHSTRTGSLVTATPQDRRIVVENAVPTSGATDVRRIVRDLIFIPWLESLGAVVVHGAAVLDPSGKAVLVLGDRGAGKTTLFMSVSERGPQAALSCERIVVVPSPDGLIAFACPENISVFAGTLRSFASTADLAGVPGDGEWQRESKIRVPWRELFARLGFHAQASALVQRLVFPLWSSSSSAPHEELSRDQIFQKLLPHIVTARDANRPDWLGWFSPRHSQATIQQMVALDARAGTWQDNESAHRLMFEK